MIDSEKIEAVNAYLRAEFPDCFIEDRYEFDRISQTFRIDCKDITYLLTISREFLDDNSTPEISKLIKEHALSDSLRAAGRTRVLLTNKGVSLEGEGKKPDLTTDQMILYLEDKWKGRSCPMCGAQQWGVTDSVYELKARHKGAFMTEGFFVPIVPVVCNNCGNTILINAITAGIVKPDRRDQQ